MRNGFQTSFLDILFSKQMNIQNETLKHQSNLLDVIHVYKVQMKFAIKTMKSNRSNHHRCSITKAVLKKFCNIHIKTPLLESLFKNVAALQVVNFIKKRQVFSCEYCEIFKNIYFEKHLRTAASELNGVLAVSLFLTLNAFTIRIQLFCFQV